ncbi:VanZ family protein [Peptostreptococcus equinus]|uniref:VanZ family protein n=2 Tax=Peptostreptococcus equinus TaxID=3003601 RepID=A0ABY7JSN0_9FIRM|nr:VanZ family protein [Peptostreptococcus sp. CBA3647]WAW15846.1 VanZ family protein [Peptostreptococcus sp. CBA3647]
MLLIWLVVFKLNFSISDIHKVRDINLIPFHYENVMEGDIPLFEALLNVIVFVPFGFLLHKAFYWKFLKEILLIAGISFAFEVTQYVLAIQYCCSYGK